MLGVFVLNGKKQVSCICLVSYVTYSHTWSHLIPRYPRHWEHQDHLHLLRMPQFTNIFKFNGWFSVANLGGIVKLLDMGSGSGFVTNPVSFTLVVWLPWDPLGFWNYGLEPELCWKILWSSDFRIFWREKCQAGYLLLCMSYFPPPKTFIQVKM